MKHDTSTFISGYAPFYDFFFFAKELDELVDKGVPNSSFFLFDEEDESAQFRQYDESVGWPAISMASIKPDGDIRVVVAISPYGDYWEVEPLSTHESIGKIKNFNGNLRALSVIDDSIFVCGMNREVLLRESEGQWKSIGPGSKDGDADVIGFEDIDGYSKSEMYAVGWGGEIWWFDEGIWRNVDSPTSINLSSVYCGENGIVYIVGHDGIMLQGRHDKWSIVDTDRKENLRDVAFYKGTVYVTTDFRILKLVDGKLINDTNFADPNDPPVTCLHLLTAKDGLVSLGTKDIFRLQQNLWTRLV